MFEQIKNFIYEEDGMGTVEVIVIVTVLIAAALMFKSKITSTVDTLWDEIFAAKKNAIVN